jgi:hypothetical protein
MEYKIDIEKQIKFIERDIILAKDRLRTLEADLKEAMDLLAEKEWGVKVGSIVIDRINGKTHRITEILSRGSGFKPWIKAVLKKKNGGWCKTTRSLYNDWELE